MGSFGTADPKYAEFKLKTLLQATPSSRWRSNLKQISGNISCYIDLHASTNHTNNLGYSSTMFCSQVMQKRLEDRGLETTDFVPEQNPL